MKRRSSTEWVKFTFTTSLFYTRFLFFSSSILKHDLLNDGPTQWKEKEDKERDCSTIISARFHLDIERQNEKIRRRRYSPFHLHPNTSKSTFTLLRRLLVRDLLRSSIDIGVPSTYGRAVFWWEIESKSFLKETKMNEVRRSNRKTKKWKRFEIFSLGRTWSSQIDLRIRSEFFFGRRK